MKKLLLIGLVLCAGPLAHAQDAPNPPPGVIQLWNCHLQPGQNVDDVFGLLEALRDGATQREPGFSMFLWLPRTGAIDYDFAFGTTATDLVALAEGAANYASSGNAARMARHFQDVITGCDSVILLSEQVHTGAIGQTGDRLPDAVTETFACRTTPGSDMDDVEDTVKAWQEQMAKMDSPELKTYDAYMVTPFRGGSGEVEFGWISSYPDIVSWGKGEQAWNDSKGGQALNDRWNKVSACRSAMWNGYWIVPPAG
ncbi:MAG TPA: hypothetical protein VIS76_05885 [Pseudomonadales bacterium]